MEQEKLVRLQEVARQIRLGLLEGIYNAKSGHPGGSLSVADLLAYLYFCEMRVESANPKKVERDRLVLSKGHAAPALYAALAQKGFFPVHELKHLRQIGSFLQGHPDMKHIPGVDMSTGSLGQGVSAACGMALAGKLQNNDYRVYAILGDGELQEGQVWEAAMFAAHNRLHHLCLLIDNNGLQIDGSVDEICSPYPIDEKYRAFGFHVVCIDGHDFKQMEQAFTAFHAERACPTVIICKTIKGKGVSFMENQVSWHGSAPNEEEYRLAVQELEACRQL